MVACLFARIARASTGVRRLVMAWTIFTVLGVAGFSSAQPPPSANRVEASDQEDNHEIEEFQAAEDELDEELEELLDWRTETQEQLERLQQSVERTKQRLQTIDQVIALKREHRQIESALEQAEDRGDQARTRQLELRLERLETHLELQEDLLDIEIELAEVSEFAREAKREDFEDLVEPLQELAEGLRRVSAAKRELIAATLDEPESKQELLKQQLAQAWVRVERLQRIVRWTEELLEAEEDEDDALIEELEQKLRELRELSDSSGEAAGSPREKQQEPAIQPILVNDQTLREFAGANIQRDVAPLLRRFCIDCHGHDASSGDLNLEKLLAESPIVKNRDQWINVIEQSRNHVMPPEEEPQPSLDERRRIVLSLHHAVHHFDYRHIHDPGYETARRLSHQEYSNTVRDLFGIDIDVLDRFPTDLSGTSGFDNSANSLFIQPLLMERYIGTAEHVVSTALPEAPRTAEERVARDRILPKIPISENEALAAAGQALKPFLLRAYRRPPTDEELQRSVEQVRRGMADGADFFAAMQAAIQTVLISPKFLLLSERDHAHQGKPFAISDWELASRLSYFLWSSMPDNRLFELALREQLSNPSVLEDEVRRMIADPKADALGTNFAAQWLGSQHLGKRVRLDPIDNPWCTESLMAAMRQETAMFFCSLVRENRPITELIDADYTYLNEELANLYRIANVSGTEMRRVAVDPRRRGGIFGHGSLLAVTAFPGRTSPVVRGKWILANVLGTPPPPPPPNVSELSEEIEDNDRLSFREKLELHRRKPNCYACHSQMDPLGFSLEQYDWFGRYRTRRGRSRIDATGQLPNGTEFRGLSGLKRVIVEERHDDLIRQLTQKMLSYALGRQLEYYDEPAVRRITSAVSADGDRLQTLVQEIVKSFPFRYKQHRATPFDAAHSPREENR